MPAVTTVIAPLPNRTLHRRSLVSSLRNARGILVVCLQQRQEALFEGRLRRADLDQPVEHHQPVGHPFQLAQEMAADEDGPALFAKAPHQFAHLDDPRRVKAICGLVQKQQLRIRKQRHRQAEALLHPQRVTADPIVRSLVEVDQLEHFSDPRLGMVAEVGQHLQVLAPAESG